MSLLNLSGFQGDVQSAASVQAIARQVCEQLIQSESPSPSPSPSLSRVDLRPDGAETLKTFPLRQVTWLTTAPSSTVLPVHQCPSELWWDHRESRADRDPQGPRENRGHREDLASPVRMARMANRGNEAHPEKRVKKGLKALDSKATEDHQDLLVTHRTIQFCSIRALKLFFLPHRRPWSGKTRQPRSFRPTWESRTSRAARSPRAHWFLWTSRLL